MDYRHIVAERRGAGSKVGWITLHRPQQLNALCDALVDEMVAALDDFEADDAIGD